ncbi:hypothetical protein F511_07235 [Dorcoceras hygrometricum]|uniref:Uncharacterized protein n=1 Tax=Dorcoceras hygrometricum TaxID=472368 RepID=A0A2Z7AQB8_9LAMI|nr:hypothetical protein F511_07235 [Dorcoceras hygrometricum]
MNSALQALTRLLVNSATTSCPFSHKKDDRYRRDDKKEDRYKRDDKTEERTVDRSKDRSKDRWMRTRDSTSSSSSSSDSEQEEVHCLMADQTSDDEVFDFSNIEFTREDLISALNDMVKEYRKLSRTFEEVKAENNDLKISSVEPSAVELGEADSLKIE